MSRDAESSQPHEHEDHEGQAIGACEFVAVCQEAQAGTGIASRPLIAGEPLTTQMGGELGAESLLVMDIFHVRL